MHTSTTLFILLSLTTQLTHADPVAFPFPDPVALNLPAGQTIVPFTTLPACAQQCGVLFDVQGACSPPNVPAANTKTCFCADSRLTAFETSSAGVCDVAGCSSGDLTKIQQWYKTLCASSTTGTGATTATTGTAGATGTGSTSSGSGSGATSSGDGNTPWISTHLKYVIMLVILIIAIVGGWIGAYCLRQRYLAKRDREYEMKAPIGGNSAWGAGAGAAAGGAKGYYGGNGKEAISRPMPAFRGFSENGLENEAEKKRKWKVSERT